MTDPNAQHLLDLDWLSADERGRRLLYRLMLETGFTKYAAVVSDPHAVMFNAGRQSIAEPFLRPLLTRWPDRLALALRENQQATDDRAGDHGDGNERPDDD
jgi:hypothetical protein